MWKEQLCTSLDFTRMFYSQKELLQSKLRGTQSEGLSVRLITWPSAPRNGRRNKWNGSPNTLHGSTAWFSSKWLYLQYHYPGWIVKMNTCPKKIKNSLVLIFYLLYIFIRYFIGLVILAILHKRGSKTSPVGKHTLAYGINPVLLI